MFDILSVMVIFGLFLSLLLIVLGVNRFYDNLEMMYGFRINPYMKIGWTFTAPIFCMVG